MAQEARQKSRAGLAILVLGGLALAALALAGGRAAAATQEQPAQPTGEAGTIVVEFVG